MVPAAIQGVTVSAPAHSQPVTVALGMRPRPRPRVCRAGHDGMFVGFGDAHHVGLTGWDVHLVEEGAEEPEGDGDDDGRGEGE